MTKAFYDTFIIVLSGLMPIINPPATALLFLTVTRRASREVRQFLARKIAINAIFVILPSMYFGAFVLQMFGISIPVLRLAGGLVLAAAGWRLLHAPTGDSEAGSDATPHDKNLKDMAFYPLTMPLTTGPGTIAVSIAVGSTRSRPGTAPLEVVLGNIAGGLLAVAITVLTIYFCYRYADRLEDKVGHTGSEALSRVFAFMLICLGVQILWNGFADLWVDLAQRAAAVPN
ncbi:MarC family NAAT transporter [Uliginosibacterium sp. H1]|uniref:MarC family NAAT transporter n=1 Tax=Uliginosibacterium sp. H1 TaxID=3114757 RepID=UPI002E19C066|nr:MarC family NAAT transporter [Uliginosibacterium sp. H1]